MSRRLAVKTESPGVTVVRFTKPDIRPYLDDYYPDIVNSLVFRELKEHVLDCLGDGDCLVLNLGNVEMFTSPFVALLLRLRQWVRFGHGSLLLCDLRPEHREILRVTKTADLFQIMANEKEASSHANAPVAGSG
jgi:anti-anti-sigma factor